MAQRESSADAARPFRRLAAGVCLVQVVLLLGFAGYFALEIGRGQSGDPVRAWMSVVMMLFAGAGLSALARAWLTTQSWQAMPTLLWHGLLVPVAWSLAQGGQLLWFGGVVAAVVLAILATVRVGAIEGTDPESP